MSRLLLGQFVSTIANKLGTTSPLVAFTWAPGSVVVGLTPWILGFQRTSIAFDLSLNSRTTTLFWLGLGLILGWLGGQSLQRSQVSYFKQLLLKRLSLNSQAELDARIRQQAAIAQLGQLALQVRDLNQIFDATVKCLAAVLQIDYAKILAYDAKAHNLRIEAGVGWQPSVIIGQTTVPADTFSQAGYTLLCQEPVIVNNLACELRFQGTDILLSHGIVSGISVVIPGETGPFGVLSVHTTKARRFSPDDIYLFEAIAHLLSAAIERRNAEVKLQLMERAINASSNGVIITDPRQPDNPIVYANQAVEKITGYSQTELLGQNCRIFQGENTNSSALTSLRQSLQTAQACHVTLLNYRKDNSPFWNELYISPVFDHQCNLTHFVGIQTDVTEPKSAQAVLIETQTRLSQIVNTNSDALIVVNRDGLIQFANPAAEKLFGRPQTDLLDHWLGKLYVVSDIAEITIVQPTGNAVIAEMRVVELTWDGESAFLASLRDVTQRVETDAEIRKTRNFLQAIVDHLPVALFVKEVQSHNFGEYRLWNPACEKVFDLTAEQVIGKTANDIFPTSIACSIEQQDRLLVKNGNPIDIPEEHINQHVIHTIKVPICGDDGDVSYLLCISEDLTARKQTEAALAEQEIQYRRIVETAAEGIWIVDSDYVTYFANQQMADMLGFDLEELEGRSLLSFLAPSSHALALAKLNQRSSHLSISTPPDFEFLRKDGKSLWGNVSTTPHLDHQGNYLGSLVMVNDVTHRRQMEKQLMHSALHDDLTELPNRLLFFNRLEHRIQRAKTTDATQAAVLFLDLDRFKLINDSLGHIVGDKLLVAIARRLEKHLGSEDTLARLGGDEFAILLNDIQDIKAAVQIADCINQALSRSFKLNDYDIYTTVSIGIALVKPSYQQAEALLRDADNAMYQAKERGKACYAIFDEAMHQQSLQRLHLENDLQRALESQALELYYQPIVQLSTMEIKGFEALLRWHHPKQGLVDPAEFIPIAEETGLIVPIGLWVMETACQQLARWRKQFSCCQDWTISLNLSGQQLLDQHLINHVLVSLLRSGLPNACLKLEITESSLIENTTVATHICNTLRQKGIKLAIDDFGTGYSSLNYLHRFPFHTLKIDQQFVARLSDRAEDNAIVKTVAHLAHNMSMDVVAEGIETQQQAQFLQHIGCEYGQGYLFSPPLPAVQAQALIHKQNLSVTPENYG